MNFSCWRKLSVSSLKLLSLLPGQDAIILCYFPKGWHLAFSTWVYKSAWSRYRAQCESRSALVSPHGEPADRAAAIAKSSVLRCSAGRPRPQIKGPPAPKPVSGVCVLSRGFCLSASAPCPTPWGPYHPAVRQSLFCPLSPSLWGRGCSGLSVIPRTFWSQLGTCVLETAVEEQPVGMICAPGGRHLSLGTVLVCFLLVPGGALCPF